MIFSLKSLEEASERIDAGKELEDDGYVPHISDVPTLIRSALYYARRCQILEGQLTKTRADLREIVSDATTSRAQAALAEDGSTL